MNALEKSTFHLNSHPFASQAFKQLILPCLESSQTALHDLRKKFVKLNEAWKELALYFGEELEEYNSIVIPATQTDYLASKKMPLMIFSMIDLFFASFCEAIEQNKKKKKDEERKMLVLKKKKNEKSLKVDVNMNSNSNSNESGNGGKDIGTKRLEVGEAEKMAKRFSILVSKSPKIENLKVVGSPRIIAREEVQEY